MEEQICGYISEYFEPFSFIFGKCPLVRTAMEVLLSDRSDLVLRYMTVIVIVELIVGLLVMVAVAVAVAEYLC